jgi:hypothetical protein
VGSSGGKQLVVVVVIAAVASGSRLVVGGKQFVAAGGKQLFVGTSDGAMVANSLLRLSCFANKTLPIAHISIIKKY